MKFSIITCTYNSDKWLMKNIESVSKQSYKNYEHVFVDGFSTDQTIKIIENYKNIFPDKVKIIQSKPKGISNAMNEGAKNSTGDYLIHLHSDDSFFDYDVLKDAHSFLDDNKMDWIYGKINVVEENGKNVGTFPNKKLFQQNYKNIFGQYLLKFFNFIPHQAVFIKKEVFENYGYFDDSISSSMDSDFWLKIRKNTSWCFVDRIISNYCIRNTSQSANFKNKVINKKNYEIVQSRYLNVFEHLLAKIVNLLLEKKNKNYR